MVNQMRVLASGVFDLLHYGHIRFLEEARKLGEPNARLTVIVASDETVFRAKGKPPIMPESQRRALVEALKVVDEAIIGGRNLDMDKVMKETHPEIVAVGHDQQDIEDQAKKLITEKNYDIKVLRVGKFGPDHLNSSSKIKKRIVERSEKRV
jgi:FAD synthetase